MGTYILIVENRPPRALERYVETFRGVPEIGIRGYEDSDREFEDTERSTFQTASKIPDKSLDTGAGLRHNELMNITHELRHRFPTAANFDAHNKAIQHFALNLHRESETPILNIVMALDGWLHTDGANDGYGGENVTLPLYHALIHALNFSTGRLDAGTISGWAYDAVAAAGLNPDN